MRRGDFPDAILKECLQLTRALADHGYYRTDTPTPITQGAIDAARRFGNCVRSHDVAIEAAVIALKSAVGRGGDGESNSRRLLPLPQELLTAMLDGYYGDAKSG
ncbi:MAG: hypothetical protein ABJD07_09960 [Gemmatimonadaceae bacterium]